jgi:hypothetical protein
MALAVLLDPAVLAYQRSATLAVAETWLVRVEAAAVLPLRDLLVQVEARAQAARDWLPTLRALAQRMRVVVVARQLRAELLAVVLVAAVLRKAQAAPRTPEAVVVLAAALLPATAAPESSSSATPHNAII